MSDLIFQTVGVTRGSNSRTGGGDWSPHQKHNETHDWEGPAKSCQINLVEVSDFRNACFWGKGFLKIKQQLGSRTGTFPGCNQLSAEPELFVDEAS